MSAQSFNADEFKVGQEREWNASAPGWQEHWNIWEKGAQHVNDRLVALAQIQPGHKVVDIASGIGEPAFTIARQVEPTGQVIGTDIAVKMLAIARERAKTLGLPQIEFREMDAEAPNLPHASFDAVVCRFGLMFLPNLPIALSRLRQLLVPGGRFAAAVWGTADQVAYTILNRSIRRVLTCRPLLLDNPAPLAWGRRRFSGNISAQPVSVRFKPNVPR